MNQIAILEVFAKMPDRRRCQGKRHSLQLCLALFTLAVAAGNRGFIALGDWLKCYGKPLKELFEVERLPSYSTIRRTLLTLDKEEYCSRLEQFFDISPQPGETIGLDGKVLRGSYLQAEDNPESVSHPAIMLVSAYVEMWGLILKPYQVEKNSNEITALPPMIKALALSGVVFAFDAINTQKKL